VAAQVSSLEQQVALDVWSAYYGLQTAVQRMRTSSDLLASATESEHVALARYKEGVGSLLDALVAQLALAGARAEGILARTDFFTSLARLGYATGKLDPLHIEAIVPAGSVMTPPDNGATKNQEP
jgi:outer membrane protein